MAKLGLIVRADMTGLGNQTRNLMNMLSPDAILVIDFSKQNGNKQDFRPFIGKNYEIVKGFPTNKEVDSWIYRNRLEVIMSCEIFYSNLFVDFAEKNYARTILQVNHEFNDYLMNKRLKFPTVMLIPSTWYFKETKNLFSTKKVEYLPPPLDYFSYANNRHENFKRKGKKRFLHIIGKAAANDRNGTEDLISALKECKEDFELVIKSQFPIEYNIDDPRVTLEIGSPSDERELYKNFDAMIMPRRYGGLCLPMNEALASGIPVIMTDISPNNDILPKEWLVESSVKGTFMTRTKIFVYQTDKRILANKIDEFAKMSQKELKSAKGTASSIAWENFSYEKLKPKYEELINETIR